MQSIQNKISVGIIGGAGYTGGELIRILLNHPRAAISFVNSSSNSGRPVSSVHQDLFGDTDLTFSNDPSSDADVVFLCQGHGKSQQALDAYSFDSYTKIIDLSNDFRLAKSSFSDNRTFVYGLPELNRDKISQAISVANPGCFATAIQLALLPLAAQAHLSHDIHVHAITGSTGAGQAPGSTTHFSWRNNNVSVYKAFNHQHLAEINESLATLQPTFNKKLNFIPVRGNFTRGIFATAYTQTDLSYEEIFDTYSQYFLKHPFVHISKDDIHLKQIVNSNKCIVKLEKHDGQIFITSIIDNLVKGASGQAVQNMNLMFGFGETTGLELKTVSF